MFRAFAAARSSATIAAFGGEPKGGRGTGRCIVKAKASGGPDGRLLVCGHRRRAGWRQGVLCDGFGGMFVFPRWF